MPKTTRTSPPTDSPDEKPEPYSGPSQIEKAMAAIKGISEAMSAAAPDRIELSNGIVLGTKRMPPGIIRRLMQALPEPTVPVVPIAEKDGREEENPNDPDYLRALEACYNARIEASMMATITFATYLVSVPEGMQRPEDDEWVEEMQRVGIEPKVETPLGRYIEWLQLYALAGSDDWTRTGMAAAVRAGVLEQDVLDAVNYFRDNAGWRAARGLPALSTA